MSASSPPIREKLSAVFAAWSRGIETCVREAQADGSMRRDLNAKNVANLLLNSWQGAAMRAKVNKDNSSFVEFETVFKALTP
jgi:TetR/AcrR family transcriptional repressor of nem operon